PRALRAQRPVHEALEVADPQERAAEPGTEPDGGGGVERVVGDRLPHPERQLPTLLELPPEPQGAEPTVLVVDACDAAGVRDLHARAHRVEVRVVGDDHVALLEPPRGLLAQDAGRLALRVSLDDSSPNLEVAAREGERGRVEPERV